MDLEYLGVLESRVQAMIKLLQSTREEKRLLEEQLMEQAEAFQHLQEERNEVRQRVERILGTLNHVTEEAETALVPQGVEQEGEQETSY